MVMHLSQYILPSFSYLFLLHLIQGDRIQANVKQSQLKQFVDVLLEGRSVIVFRKDYK